VYTNAIICYTDTKSDIAYSIVRKIWHYKNHLKTTMCKSDNEEVLHIIKEETNIVHKINRKKANWIDHMLLTNCLLKHVIEGKTEGRIEMTERRIRRRKQSLDNREVKRGYWKLKEEALDRTLWRTRSQRGYGPVVRQTANRTNKPVTSNYTKCLCWVQLFYDELFFRTEIII
jgi:hypothetical protein